MEIDPYHLPRGLHALAPEIVAAVQRQRLLDGMATALMLRGYVAATVTDVVVAARVSRRTFYENFANKEECFLAAYDAGAARIFDAISVAWQPPGSWEARLAACFGAFVELVVEEPALARLCVVEVLAAGPAALERRDAALAQLALFLHRGDDFSSGRSDGPGLLPDLMAGGLYATVYARILRGDLTELRRLVPQIVAWSAAPWEEGE